MLAKKKIWLIGTTMLNEEIMHVRVRDVKSKSQGGYTMHGNASMALDPPQGNQGCNGNENSWRNWQLATKDLGKTKTIKKEAYDRRGHR